MKCIGMVLILCICSTVLRRCAGISVTRIIVVYKHHKIGLT